jgi:uncharacterized protein YgiM (DUF1202 family)
VKAKVATNNKGTLNLREGASSKAAILAKIPYGETVEADEPVDGWSHVNYKGKDGYVKYEYLDTGHTVSATPTLQDIYDSLKATLKLIEEAMK